MQQNVPIRHDPRPLTLFLQMLIDTAGKDADLIRRVLRGVRAYQDAKRPPRPSEMPVIARAGRARVLDYGLDGGRPVLFIPSLINPPYVLDLSEQNSFLRWLATQRIRPLLIDWGDPGDESKALSLSDHVETLLAPIIDQLGPDITVAGYCLGGTMAIAAAAIRPVAGLALIAAPWRFSGYPEDRRQGLVSIWTSGRPLAEGLGTFPMEMLQSAFWRLDPMRTLSKYADFGEMEPESAAADAFVLLEDWANEGPPLPVPTARELVEDMFGADLPGTGQWKIAGQTIDPALLDCPILNIISSSDKIAPSASAAPVGERHVLQQGHVGMIVGRSAKAVLWEPLSSWLSHLQHNW